MKALVGAFNQEKALVGAFSVIVKTGCGTDGALHSTNLDVDGDIELLSGGGGQPQEPDLEAVLHNVLVLRPHDLRQLLDVTELDEEKIMSILR